MNTRRQTGFTLIEMVVVMALLVIIIGMVGFNLTRDPAAGVREEAERLALLLQTAHQEAILQGRFYAISLDRKGYTFQQLTNDGVLTPFANDGLLRPRVLPEGMVIKKVTIDGEIPDEEKIGIILSPSGELPDFQIVIAEDNHRWQVHGIPNGDIQSLSVET